LVVKFWGDLACFTRPEMKVERVTYPVITPSAARGLLEAVFWKPEIRWEVREIHLLKPPRFVGLVRNEVNSKASVERALSGFYADEDRAQRHTLALRDVAYIVVADVVLHQHASSQHPAKYREQFRRRVERGQCYSQPYLGCREFTASFGPVKPSDQPIDLTEDLGLMLFDLVYSPGTGRALPIFFPAKLEKGILRVPRQLYEKGGETYAASAAG
jgi:CRISPR-associated protein Cas5d